MDEALIQNPQHKVDDQDSHEEQQSKTSDGRLKGLRCPLEAGADRGWQHLLGHLVHHRNRVAQRDAGTQVERNGHCRQLSQVIDSQRSYRARELSHSVQRNQLPTSGTNIEHRKRRRVELVLILQLRDHAIGIIGGIDSRDLALAVGRVKRVFHLVRVDAESRRVVTINLHIYLWVLDLKIAGYILQQLLIKNPQVNVEIDRDNASALGINANQVEDALYTA